MNMPLELPENEIIREGTIFILQRDDIDYHQDLGIWLALKDITKQTIEDIRLAHEATTGWADENQFIRESLHVQGFAIAVPKTKRLNAGGIFLSKDSAQISEPYDE